MRTLRPAALGTVTVLLVVGSTVGALAQDIDFRSGEFLEPSEGYIFSTDQCTRGIADEVGEGEGGSGYNVNGLPFTCEVTLSDPRLSGTQTTVLNERCFMLGGCVNWGTVELVNDGGMWSGWFTGSEYPSTGDSRTDLLIVLTASGDYDGLVNIRHVTGPFWGPMEQVGVIYAGDPPPTPQHLLGTQ